MPGNFPPDQDGSGESFRGCVVTIVASIVVLGMLCILGGYFLIQRLARLDQDPRNQPVAGNRDGARGETSGSATDGGATSAPEQKSKNRLRQIMIGMHMHHDAIRTFPPPSTASYDGTGKPLLSWRVHLLPYLD